MCIQVDGEGTQYEYKFLYAAEFSPSFANPARFRATLDEEARAGWELHTKIGDRSIRLRRHVSWREKDSRLTQDPYRTVIGLRQTRLIIGLYLVIAFVISFIIAFASANCASPAR